MDTFRALSVVGLGDRETVRATLLGADGGRLERMLREAGERARIGDIQQGFQEGRFAHGVASELGLGALVREIERLKEQLQDGDARFAQYLERRLQDLNDIIKAL